MKILFVSNKALRFTALVVTVIFTLSISFALFVYSSQDTFNEIDDGTTVSVPIVMYHSVLKSSKLLGKFVITPTELENDFKYLQERGYTAITMTQLINYVYDGSPLPEKPVVITFDDGYLNNYAYVTPLLKEYDMKAVISIVGKFSDNYTEKPSDNLNYSHVTWSQIKEMHDSGLFEIQNHTYNLHYTNKKRTGARKLKGESLATYTELMNSDVGYLQQKIAQTTGVTPNTFTYPYGFISKDSVPILKDMGFKATLSCFEGVNKIRIGDKDALFGLRRKNRPHGVSTNSFFKKLCP
jgi:peptidoglycan/xylan/chitin deacetylase (PgdA/CDA1 family)